jgi:Ran GTPase-activating protein (RanGAP) involved in mRNA processing and transport
MTMTARGQPKRTLAERLLSNDPRFTRFSGKLTVNDDNIRMRTFEALKKNTTLKVIVLKNGTMSVPASIAFADALAEHPTLKRLDLEDVCFESGFGPIASAIEKSKNLVKLVMDFRDLALTDDVNNGIRRLVKTNSVELLVVDVFNSQEGQNLDLSGVIRRNTSLKTLFLRNMRHDAGMSFSERTLVDLSRFLKMNQNVREINLFGASIGTWVLGRIALAATGHQSLEMIQLHNKHRYQTLISPSDASLVSGMLSNTPSLRQLDMCLFPFEREAFRTAFDGLRSDNCKLLCLDLSFCRLLNDAVSYLADILATHGTIYVLNLQANQIGDEGACAIAEMLKRNKTIEHLDLQFNAIGPAGASAIANALRRHTSVDTLWLSGNPIGDEGAASFAEALIENTVMTTLRIAEFGDLGLNAFARTLPLLRRVETIEFCWLKEITSNTTSSFLRGLEQNTEIRRIAFCDPDDAHDEMPEHVSSIMPQVERLLALNRGGRRILKSLNVPASLWPLILARSCDNPDVLFYFLCEKPAELIGAKKPDRATRVTRKRKRDE